MKTMYLVGPFNDWSLQQKFAFSAFEGKYHTLLAELPAGAQAFKIAQRDGDAQDMLGGDGGGGALELEREAFLAAGGGNLELQLARPGIYLFNIDASREGENPALVVTAKFLAEEGQGPGGQAGLGLEHFLEMELPVEIEVGKTRMPLGEAMTLGPGSVVELDRLAGDTVNVYVAGRLVAIGEPVVMNDAFGVRILEILPPA